jgi:hypothetical protein
LFLAVFAAVQPLAEKFQKFGLGQLLSREC